MLNKIRGTAVISLLIMSAKFAFAFDPNSIVGCWQTIDDTTNQPRSIVKIYKQEGKYYGQVVAVTNYLKGESYTDKCTACSDDRKDKTILGLTIITNMRQDPDNPLRWMDGQILDPKNGNIYRSKLTLINVPENEQQATSDLFPEHQQDLDVRGYIGISLFGRSQTWHRMRDDVLTLLPKGTHIADNITHLDNCSAPVESDNN